MLPIKRDICAGGWLELCVSTHWDYRGKDFLMQIQSVSEDPLGISGYVRVSLSWVHTIPSSMDEGKNSVLKRQGAWFFLNSKHKLVFKQFFFNFYAKFCD